MSNDAPTSATVVESLIERCFGAELWLSVADDAVVAVATLVAVEAGRRKTARRGSEERAIEAIIMVLFTGYRYVALGVGGFCFFAKFQDLLGVETPSTSLFSGVKDETVLLFLLTSKIYVIREEVPSFAFFCVPFVSWVSTFSSTHN